MEVINGTSLQFYLLIRMKLDIRPFWKKKNHREAAMVVPKCQRHGSGKALGAKGRTDGH